MAMPQLVPLAPRLPASLSFPNRFRGDGKLLCTRVDFPGCAADDWRLNDDILLKASHGSSQTSCAVVESNFHSGSPPADDDKCLDLVRTLILDNYDSYTYNLYQILSIVNGVPPVVVKNDELTFHELYRLLYTEKAFENVVISPGPGSPACSSDIGVCMRLLQECHDIPVLGVCMGHQALGFSHGMKVLHAPEPVHGRLSEIEHLQHPLFNGIPSGPEFKVVRYHSLILDSTTLPPSLIATAWSVSERPLPCQQAKKNNSLGVVNGSSKLLMGVSHKSWPHHGVQFHPESIATTHGQRLLENFRDITRRYWKNNPSRTLQPSSRKKARPLEYKRLKPERVKLSLCFKKLQGVLKLIGDSETIFSKLHGASQDDTFWLDSSNVDQGRARYSYMGGKGGSLWRKVTYTITNNLLGQGVLRAEKSSGEVTENVLRDGFFDYLDKELQRYACETKLPFDFVGGFVGYIGYELKSECGASSNRHKSSSPDAAFFLADRFVAVDHLTGDVFTVAVHDEFSTKDAESWIEATAETILELSRAAPEAPDDNHEDPANNSGISSSQDQQQVAFIASRTKAEYMKDVQDCLRFISDGESYELCLTTQLKRQGRVQDPLAMYTTLRRINPAPYSAWLQFAGAGPCICSSSPERFLRLTPDGMLEAKPIKGTVPRGDSPEEDEILRAQLQQSEKDQAENLMIVDLLRNDLGRVCVPGTVHVPHLMAVESYSTVHTLVSTVRGRKREEVSGVECVRAAFPGGSMTGAPKLRSMAILDRVEACARGVYSGSIGFFSVNGSLDLNIVIRTVVIEEQSMSIGAGGAIVALSDPENEYQEMLLKTKAPTRACNKHF